MYDEYTGRGKSRASYVYAIESSDGRYTKIGVAFVLKNRTDAIIGSAPFKCKLKHSVRFHSRKLALQVEKRIHLDFSEFRTNGEWFRIPKELKPNLAGMFEPIQWL